MLTYASVEQFYAENVKRRWSPEHDFGVWWKDSAGGAWRVSWVEDTGEVYAIRRGPAKTESLRIAGELITFGSAGSPETEGPLIVLAVVPASEGECTNLCCHGNHHSLDCPASKSYNVEQRLQGWAEICGAPYSLDWAKGQLSS